VCESTRERILSENPGGWLFIGFLAIITAMDEEGHPGENPAETSFSCDWGERQGEPVGTGPFVDRVHAYLGNGVWEGIPDEKYKTADGTFSDVVRRTLVGNRGEKTGFHVRYFEIGPGGRTTWERHVHEHVVVVVRGRGRVRLEEGARDLGVHDTVYVAPGRPHQFSNPFEDPFGFLCIVDAVRDRPEPLPEPLPERPDAPP